MLSSAVVTEEVVAAAETLFSPIAAWDDELASVVSTWDDASAAEEDAAGVWVWPASGVFSS